MMITFLRVVSFVSLWFSALVSLFPLFASLVLAGCLAGFLLFFFPQGFFGLVVSLWLAGVGAGDWGSGPCLVHLVTLVLLSGCCDCLGWCPHSASFW